MAIIQKKIEKMLNDADVYNKIEWAVSKEKAEEYCRGQEIYETEHPNGEPFMVWAWENPEPPPSTDEIIQYTQLKMARDISVIKKIAIFFCVLGIAGLILGILSAVGVFDSSASSYRW